MAAAVGLSIACLAIFLLNVALNWPLFLPGESAYRESIEAGYKGMARFFAEHPNPWGWNPLQYCGQPLQFTYLPLLHYASAALASVARIEPGTSYKVVTTSLAAFGPSALLIALRTWSGSALAAVSVALAASLTSPLYGLIRQMDADRGIVYLPWRMHVFAKYGEGPHTSGLTLMMLALAMAWVTATATDRRAWHVPVTAALFAAVCLTNWVSALALGIAMLLMFAAAFRSVAHFGYGRLMGAALLAYGMAAWWLTPTFIHTVAFNWPEDAFNYKLQAAQHASLAAWLGGLLLLHWTARALRWRFLPTYGALCTWAFGYIVLVYYAFGVDTIPESRRYAIEFSFFLFLFLFEFFRWGLTSPNRVRQVCAAVVAVALGTAATQQVYRYVTQGHSGWMPHPTQNAAEYRIARWITEQKPQGRVLASGGLRFQLNSWFDLQQTGGSFESGLRNRVPVHFSYQIRTGLGSAPATETAEALLQMKALGVEYVVVHGPESDEYYRDYRNPLKFEGTLDKPYSQGNDWVYRVPFRSLAHLIRAEEQPAYAHRGWLGRYVAAIEDSHRPALQTQWLNPSVLEVRGPMPAGHDVVLAVTEESGWRATQDGKPIRLERNALNFIVAKTIPSTNSTIRFEYRGTPEQRGFGVLSAFVWVGTAWRIWRRRSR